MRTKENQDGAHGAPYLEAAVKERSSRSRRGEREILIFRTPAGHQPWSSLYCTI